MEDSTSNSNLSSSLPRARSLLDLPTELLGVIVKMCADQDEAFRHRAKLIKAHPMHRMGDETILDDQAAKGFGFSVNTMFRLCRRTKILATPYIFKTLKASRTVSDLSYRFFIAPRYLSHYQHLVLDLADKEKAIDIIASLDSFSNLNELTLEAEAVSCAIGSMILEEPTSNFPVLGMLQRKGTSITTLHLRDFNFMHRSSINYFYYFPNLQSLTLTGLLRMDRHSATTLVKSIAHLEELKLDLEFRIPAVLLEDDRRWPPLKKLSITTDVDLYIGTLEFIRIFESSLLELSISTPSDSCLVMFVEGRPYPALPVEASFPRLRSISVLGSSLVGWCVFGNSTKSTFPALNKVRLSYSSSDANCGFAEEDEVLNKILTNCPIRDLTYIPQDQEVLGEDRTYLEQKAAALGIRLSLRDSSEETFPTIHFLEGQQYAIHSASYEYRTGPERWVSESRAEQLERIREYLDDRIKVAKLTGNTVEYQRILNFLRPLEYERLAQMD